MITAEKYSPIDFLKLRNICKKCSLSQLCLPRGLEEKDIDRIEALIQKRKILKVKEHLFQSGNQFQALYAARSGSIKSYLLDKEGNEQVLGFHLPGELLGLDGVYSGKHKVSAVALEISHVCWIPFTEITQLAAELPSLQYQLFRLLSQKFSSETAWSGDFTAEERLARFLLSLSRRFQRRGFSEKTFNLSMPRGDIANYLHMATETISRILARFQTEGLLRVDRREVHLLNLNELKKVGRYRSESV